MNAPLDSSGFKRPFFRWPSKRRLAALLFIGGVAGFSAREYARYLDRFGGMLPESVAREQQEIFNRVFDPGWKKSNAEVDRYFKKMEKLMGPITKQIGTEPGAETGKTESGLPYYYIDRKGNQSLSQSDVIAGERKAWEKDLLKILEKDPALRKELGELKRKGMVEWRRWCGNVRLLMNHDRESNAEFNRQKEAQAGWKKARGRILAAAGVGVAGIGALGVGRLLDQRKRRAQNRPPTRNRGPKK